MEIALFIRYFGIMLISLYVYTRILNIKDLPKTKIAAAVIFALMVGVLLSNRLLFSQAIVLISVCFFVSIMMAKVEKGFMISAVVIAVGISLGLETLGTLILIIAESICFSSYMALTGVTLTPAEIAHNPFISSPIIAEIFVLLISICLLKFLSKIKRLKKGFIRPVH